MKSIGISLDSRLVALVLFLVFFDGSQVVLARDPGTLTASRQRVELLLTKDFKELPALNVGENLSARAWLREVPQGPLVVLISGTHGAEGPPGFEVQELFLQEFDLAYAQKGRSLLLIHGLNPWGIEKGRRVTANNVDLNRHFHSGSIDNPGFQSLSPYLRKPLPAKDSWGTWFRRAQALLQPLIFFELSRAEITQAVAGGQTSDPQGLFFGGLTAEPQKAWLKQVIVPVIQRASLSILLDLHTGLGSRGTLHLMPGGSTGHSPLSRWLNSQTWPSGIEWTPSQAKGFYVSLGDVLSFLEFESYGRSVQESPTSSANQGSPTPSVITLTLEWGTQGKGLLQQISSLNTMALENEGWQSGWASENDRAQVQSRYRELFAPEDSSWRRQLQQSSREFFQSLDRGLATLSP